MTFNDYSVQLSNSFVKFNELTANYFENGFTSSLIYWISILFAAYIVYKLSKKFLKTKHIDNEKSIIKILRVFIILIVGYNCLMQFKPIQGLLKTLLASGGIIALAFSLAAQESVSNLVAGFIILIFKPFKVGDYIKINNGEYIGTVEEISFRHTIIKTREYNRITIPNSIVNNSSIENANLISAKKANILELQIGYSSDMDKAMEIIREIAEAHPLCIDRRTEEEKEKGISKVIVKVVDLAEYGIILRATIFSETSFSGFEMMCDLRHDIKLAFDENGIEIPYPTRKIEVTSSTSKRGGIRNRRLTV